MSYFGYEDAVQEQFTEDEIEVLDELGVNIYAPEIGVDEPSWRDEQDTYIVVKERRDHVRFRDWTVGDGAWIDVPVTESTRLEDHR